MGRGAPSEGARDSGRFANVFVLVALVAMLVGTVFILAARDPGSVEVPAGESVEVLRHATAAWNPFGDGLEAVVTTNQPFNFTTLEVSGSGKAEAKDFHDENGTRVRWSVATEPGEEWSAVLTNMGNESFVAATTVSDRLAYVIGGVFVVVGITGFVSYRVGMRHSAA